MIQLNWSVALLFLSGLVSAVLALYMNRHSRRPGKVEFAGLLAALAVWSFATAFEGASLTQEDKISWAVVSYFGSQAAPPLLLLAIFKFTRATSTLPRRLPGALFIIPVISLVMAATNQWHGWLWPTVELVETQVFGLIGVFAHGPWFWLMIAYDYMLIAAAFMLLVRTIFRFPRVIAAQNLIMLAAALVPWLVNGYYLFGKHAMTDLTPFAFLTSSLLLAWGIFRHGLLEISPVARDAVLDNLTEGVLVMDDYGHILQANPAFRALFQLPPRIDGKPAAQVLADWPELCLFIASATAQAHAFATSLEFQAGGDPERWFHVHLSRLPERADSAPGCLLTARDITARKRSDASLLARQRFANLLNEITQQALIALDQQAMLQTLADRASELLDADCAFITLWDEAKQMAFPAAAYGPLRDSYLQHMPTPGERSLTRSVMETQEVLLIEDVFDTPYLGKDIAVHYPIKSAMALPMIAGGRKLGAVLIAYHRSHHFTPQEKALGTQAAGQISLAVLKGLLLHEAQAARALAESNNRHLKQALDQLHLAITTDRMTGAFNRTKFDQDVCQELNRVKRYELPLCLVMIDVDYFKRVNDTFGHAAGDQTLIELVSLLSKNLRATDLLYRWGGEEFLILCPGIELAQAVILGEKLLRVVTEHEFSRIGRLTLSLGITNVVPSDDPDSLLARADQALYCAKNNGRSRVEAITSNAPGDKTAGRWQQFMFNENEP